MGFSKNGVIDREMNNTSLGLLDSATKWYIGRTPDYEPMRGQTP